MSKKNKKRKEKDSPRCWQGRDRRSTSSSAAPLTPSSTPSNVGADAGVWVEEDRRVPGSSRPCGWDDNGIGCTHPLAYRPHHPFSSSFFPSHRASGRQTSAQTRHLPPRRFWFPPQTCPISRFFTDHACLDIINTTLCGDLAPGELSRNACANAWAGSGPTFQKCKNKKEYQPPTRVRMSVTTTQIESWPVPVLSQIGGSHVLHIPHPASHIGPPAMRARRVIVTVILYCRPSLERKMNWPGLFLRIPIDRSKAIRWKQEVGGVLNNTWKTRRLRAQEGSKIVFMIQAWTRLTRPRSISGGEQGRGI